MGREFITIEQCQLDPETLCECSDCGEQFTIYELDEPEGAILTPGDTVPAGRCPECEALAYVLDDKA